MARNQNESLRITAQDIEDMHQLRKNAPHTWRCTSQYYAFGEKLGYPMDNGYSRGLPFPDSDRDKAIDALFPEEITKGLITGQSNK